jgi:hypothetical protein
MPPHKTSSLTSLHSSLVAVTYHHYFQGYLFLQQSSSIVGFICGSSSILYATHATQPPPPQMFGFCSHLNHLLLHYVAGGKKLTNELVAGL